MSSPFVGPVRNICLAQPAEVEQPLPGNGAFHRTFVVSHFTAENVELAHAEGWESVGLG